MIELPLALVTLVAAVALALAGCSKGADLTGSRAQAFERVSGYGPQVLGLLGTLRALADRAHALPPDTAGLDGVHAGFEAQQATVVRLKGLLDGFAAAVDAAAKSGKKTEIEKVVTGFTTDMDKGLADAKAGLAALDKTVGELEAAAKAATIDAGVPVDAGPPDARSK